MLDPNVVVYVGSEVSELGLKWFKLVQNWIQLIQDWFTLVLQLAYNWIDWFWVCLELV